MLVGLLYTYAIRPTIYLRYYGAVAAQGEAGFEGGGGGGGGAGKGGGRGKGAGRGKAGSKQAAGRARGTPCSLVSGSLKGVGSAAASGVGGARAARVATPAKNPERARQSLKNCVNWACEQLALTPRSSTAVACGNMLSSCVIVLLCYCVVVLLCCCVIV